MFKNPFSFHGRIRRLEYVLSWLIYYVYSSVAFFALQSLGQIDQVAVHMKFMEIKIPIFDSPAVMITYLPLLWFMISQRAKRCHDRGNSGWFQIIPLYGLWMLFADGEIGDNEYGESPKDWEYEYEDSSASKIIEH